jgi:hypothetical protein
MRFRSAKTRATGCLLAALVVSACDRAPPAPTPAPLSATVALIADPWFTCTVVHATTTYIASKPSASGVFKLQELDRVSGKLVSERNLRQGEPDAGARNLYTPFLLDGQAFGTLHSLNGRMLDPPSSQNLPVELRIGDQTMACERPAPTEQTSGEQSVKLIATQLLGTWSFDRSCASGDGMTFNADGSASFNTWGEGAWSLAGDHRVELALRRVESGIGGAPSAERVRYSINITQDVADTLVGTLIAADGREPPRAINARRCTS